MTNCICGHSRFDHILIDGQPIGPCMKCECMSSTSHSIKEWIIYVYEWAKGKGWWTPQCKHEHVTYLDNNAWCPKCGSIKPYGEEWRLPSTTQRNHGELMLLFTSEVAEAFEELRKGKTPTEIYYENNKPEGVPIEIADIVIRIFDYCGAMNIDLENALLLKMAYNETRSYRHGGKLA